MNIREEFLNFFESKGHKVVQSAPLVPEDETLLFTNAGMVPFKSVFTGKVSAPNPPKATSCQTCIRAGGKHNDLDNVGYTARHHTFFEMLGNFSFGDYFKEEAIAYAWEFVTEVLKFNKDKLWVTVHDSDEEAEKIWSKHIVKDRILRFGDKDNFWQMGDTGPCGPCSEIFVDQGEEHFKSSEDCMGGDGDRFLEIWNLVFMQYEKGADGKLTPLPKPSIDTGMGLERVTAIKEGKLNNYESSLFMPLIEEVAKLCGKPYQSDSGASYRVIADHIRSVVFLLAQGVNFDKEGRGYVLRRILRRAVRHGYLLGLKKPFMYKLVDVVSDLMSGHYAYLAQKRETLKQQIFLEEERFFITIASGLELFEDELRKTKKEFSADTAFKLYDTFGFPLDLTQDMLRGKEINIDIKRFDELMSEQKKRAKASWKGSGDKAVQGDFKELLDSFGVNKFVGYETTKTKAKILALLDDNFKKVDKLDAKTAGWVLLDNTPFYAQSGGQCGDSGELAGKAQVLDTQKFFDLNLIHVKTIAILTNGEEVEAIVDNKRVEITKHHSATHLLHSALRTVLGSHVAQAGSLVEAERLRFDFSHPKALSVQELKQIEDFVNSAILDSMPNITKIMSIEDAKKSGAIALFGEKYGSVVRVVKFGEVSVEFCGGVHVDNTGVIGSFFITKESGVSAGVRRIEAVCGKAALNIARSWREELGKIREEVKNKDAIIGIERLKTDIKELKSKVNSLESNIGKKLEGVIIDGVEVIVDEIKAGDIKNRIDEIKNQKTKVAVLLFQEQEGRVTIAAGSKDNVVKAGAWIKEIAFIVGGGGGGRDDFAQAGGKDASKIEEAKKAALEYAKKILKG
ncbi:MAG: alanine--tRNA ligase [Campylobacteraceae bacterium]|jgi:alanyl-tRNA synthetase|nr:alanine--tRNA ligase [Campylobacteraceae bacterium]